MHRLLDPRLAEAIIGDLDEKFSMKLAGGVPLWRAKILYIFEAAGFVRMANWWKSAHSPSFSHWRHTWTFFWRLFSRDKAYYTVATVGLAISLAAFILIGVFILSELSYDRFHQNHDRIFRVATHLKINDVDFDLATSQFPAAAALGLDFPQIESIVRLYPASRLIEIDDRSFLDQVLFADSTFFDVFSFPVRYGNVKSALSHPDNIVLTREAAEKCFGRDDVVGKTLLIEGHAVRVSAVLETIPEQSHFKFEYLMPMRRQFAAWQQQTGFEGREYKWFWVGAYTYLKLRDGINANDLSTGMREFVHAHFPDRLRGGYFELQPLTDIHLRSHLDSELRPNGDFLYIQLFGTLGLVIVVMASINLINLSYFKLGARVGEVGIRKFLGQSSWRLTSQFLSEALLLGVISFLVGSSIAFVIVPFFNEQMDTHLILLSGIGLQVLVATFLLVIAISVLSIAKPAIFLSYTKLANAFRHSESRGLSRNVFTGIQVGLSFVTLAFAFVIQQQLDFFQNTDLGFTKENIVVVNLNDDVEIESLKEQLLRQRDVVAVSVGEPPGHGYSGWRFVPEGGSLERPVMLPFTNADQDFLNTLKIDLKLGRDFDASMKKDSHTSFLINKRAAVELGWMDDALGRELSVFAPGRTEIMTTGRVVGVVDDFHSESLHEPLKPLVIAYGQYSESLLVRTSKLGSETIESLEATWRQFSDRPFQFSILDEDIRALYKNEDKLAGVVKVFTLVALYLTGYGLFAMSSLLFSTRLKEVAIRKVFGANEGTILGHFYRRYMLFSIGALVAAVPLAFWISSVWLHTFPFKFKFTPILLLQPALIVIAVGMISVSYYLARVAWSNPIRFLKHE